MSIDHDTAVGLIYQAALDPSGWHAALVAVSQLTGVQAFHMSAWNASEGCDELGIITDSGWDRALANYEAHYASTDPRISVCAGLGIGRLMVCTEHFDARFVGRSELYQDHLIPWGLRYSMAAILGRDSDLTMAVGLMRPTDAGPWRIEELAAARRLLPHMQRASTLALRERQCREERRLGDAASELTHLAIITLGLRGNVLHANRRAESLLSRHESLRLAGGRLQATTADTDAALQLAIRGVARDGKPRHISMPGRRGASNSNLTLMRASATSSQDSSLRLVCIVAEGRARIATVSQLVDWFDLTPAEARVVRALAHAGDLDRYAAEAGITRNTAKTQLAHAMSKIGVADQRELIRRVLRLPALRDSR